MSHRRIRHITSTRELDRKALESYFSQAERIARGEYVPAHRESIIATLFFEPSTRTRLSFESAASRIGARTIGIADPTASSAAKGESLVDTIRTVERYADLIVLRHPAEGSAALAAKVAHVPIINAGDGGHEHPTQTLFDLYTIRQRFGSLDGRTIGLMGDLRHGRTVHSLARAAATFEVNLIFIATDALQMPSHLLAELRAGGATIQCTAALESVINQLDVLYVTRLQRERSDDPETASAYVTLTSSIMQQAPESLLVLHPLPRVGEIACDVDEDSRAWYFEQVANGVVMRMAILDDLLGDCDRLPLGSTGRSLQIDDPPWREAADAKSAECSNQRCVTHMERDVRSRRRDGDRCAYCDHPLERV